MSLPLPLPRFQILPLAPMVVRDYAIGINIHLGSMSDAVDLCDRLNAQEEKIKALEALLNNITPKTNTIGNNIDG